MNFYGFSIRVILPIMLSGAISSAISAQTFEETLQVFETGDQANATQTFVQLAKDGDARAQVQLGIMFSKGLYVGKSQNIAQDFFEKAADQGDIQGQIHFANSLLMGKGEQKDAKRGLSTLIELAEQGQKDALYIVAEQLGAGRKDVEDEIRRGLSMLNELAEQGQKDAQYIMATQLWAGSKSVKKDLKTAISWLHRSSAQGHVGSQLLLADAYFSGHGINRDRAKAYDYYLPIAKSGNAKAQQALGWIYSQGDGIGQDENMAFYWYEKAAGQGLAGASNYVGLAYEMGAGIPQNYVIAFKWYKKAAIAGNPNAQFSLASAYEAGRGVAQNYKLAAHWFGTASGHSSPLAATAEYRYALLILAGKVIGRQPYLAHGHLQTAAQHGQPDAKKLLIKMENERKRAAAAKKDSRDKMVAFFIGVGVALLAAPSNTSNHRPNSFEEKQKRFKAQQETDWFNTGAALLLLP